MSAFARRFDASGRGWLLAPTAQLFAVAAAAAGLTMTGCGGGTGSASTTATAVAASDATSDAKAGATTAAAVVGSASASASSDYAVTGSTAAVANGASAVANSASAVAGSATAATAIAAVAAPGSTAAAPGGRLVLTIAGARPGIDHDVLAVAGKATLAGTLELQFTDGYVPPAGQRFALITAAQGCTGAFVAVTSNLPAATLTVGQDATTVYITVGHAS